MKNPLEFETWEDICEALNIDPITSLAFAEHLSDEDKPGMIAFFRLSKLSKASYQGKQPDWSNSSEYKYYPWFDMDDENDTSGFGFSYYDYGLWNTCTFVGSRLCFPSRQLAECYGKRFIAWYRDLMVLPNPVAQQKTE